jgi:hypothetical protein
MSEENDAESSTLSNSPLTVSLTALPALTLLHLGMQLDLASLAAAQRTCKRLYKILMHRFIYRVLYERCYGHAITLCCANRRLVKEKKKKSWKKVWTGE